jgi:hypothetical protein
MFVRVEEAEARLCVVDFETEKVIEIEKQPRPGNGSSKRLARHLIKRARTLNSLVVVELEPVIFGSPSGIGLMGAMQDLGFFNFWIYKLGDGRNSNKLGFLRSWSAIKAAFPTGIPKPWKTQITGLARYCLHQEKGVCNANCR